MAGWHRDVQECKADLVTQENGVQNSLKPPICESNNAYIIIFIKMHPSTNKVLSPKLSVDLGDLLGQGSTGNVYRGLCMQPQPHPIAVKVIPLDEINNEVTSYLLQCQLQALKATSHANNQSIVRLEQIVVIDNHCYIATELLEGGTLKDFIAQSKKLQPAQAIHILQKLLEAYLILKQHRIIHRDLKPDNILFTANPHSSAPTPKIIDFGYCIVDKVRKKPKMFYNVGSPRYMAPEAYTENKYTEKSDIWALGIVFYEMLTGTNFDKGKDIVETFKLIKEKGIPIPASLNAQCRKILQQMLMLDPNKRSTCEQVLQILAPSSSPDKFVFQSRKARTGTETREPRSPNVSSNVKIMVANTQSPNPRASMFVPASPGKSTGFLTKSVGFLVNPQSPDNRTKMFGNSLNLRLRSFNAGSNFEYREGPATDRSKQNRSRPFERIVKQDKTRQSNIINRTLPTSTSEQNLRRIFTQNPHEGFRNTPNVRRQNIFNEKILRNGNGFYPFRQQQLRTQEVLEQKQLHRQQMTMAPPRPTIAMELRQQTQPNPQQHQKIHFVRPNEQVAGSQRQIPGPQIQIVSHANSQHQGIPLGSQVRIQHQAPHQHQMGHEMPGNVRQLAQKHINFQVASEKNIVSKNPVLYPMTPQRDLMGGIRSSMIPISQYYPFPADFSIKQRPIEQTNI